jgi:phospholipid/cholesterol/gamma-HCH transport system substrate-binding protein
MMRKYSMETTVGVFLVVALAAVAYLTLHLGDVTLLGDNSYPLIARFTSVSGLRTGNTIEMLGIEVGRVGTMTMDQDEQVAVVELRIRNGIRVYDDSIASIRTSGLLGDKYVSLDPGGGGDLLEPGAEIVDTEPPVDLTALIAKYAFGSVEEGPEPKKEITKEITP